MRFSQHRSFSLGRSIVIQFNLNGIYRAIYLEDSFYRTASIREKNLETMRGIYINKKGRNISASA